MGSEVAETGSKELLEREAALAATSLEGFDQEDLVLPVVKLTQGLSQEVARGDVLPGHYLNTLTGHDYGEEITLVIVKGYKGRFYSPKEEERSWSANGPVAPTHWPEKYAGLPFTEIPDAEELFKQRANDPEDELEWNDGPPIRTTYNFIGFQPTEPDIPVRISLMRTSAPAGKKLATLIGFARAPWDTVFNLTVSSETNAKDQPYFVALAQRGEQTDVGTRQHAVELRELIEKSVVTYAGDEALDTADDPKQNKRASSTKPESALDV